MRRMHVGAVVKCTHCTDIHKGSKEWCVGRIMTNAEIRAKYPSLQYADEMFLGLFYTNSGAEALGFCGVHALSCTMLRPAEYIKYLL